MGALAVPGREHEIRLPLAPRVRPIREREDLHPGAVRVNAGTRTQRVRKAGEQYEQPGGEQDAPVQSMAETGWDSHIYDRAVGSGCSPKPRSAGRTCSASVRTSRGPSLTTTGVTMRSTPSSASARKRGAASAGVPAIETVSNTRAVT